MCLEDRLLIFVTLPSLNRTAEASVRTHAHFQIHIYLHLVILSASKCVQNKVGGALPIFIYLVGGDEIFPGQREEL